MIKQIIYPIPHFPSIHTHTHTPTCTCIHTLAYIMVGHWRLSMSVPLGPYGSSGGPRGQSWTLILWGTVGIGVAIVGLGGTFLVEAISFLRLRFSSAALWRSTLYCAVPSWKLSPGRPVSSLKAYVALLEVCFDVIFEPFLLATWGTLSLNKL